MKPNNYISKREYKILLSFTFSIFVFVLLVFTTQSIKAYNCEVAQDQQQLKNKAEGSSSSRQSCADGAFFAPGLHLLTFFIFISLFKTKRVLLSSFLTIFYAFIFINYLSVSFYANFLGGEEFSPKVGFFHRVYQAANSFDWIAAFFISILLFWQISILLRMLIKTIQRKPELP